jgi:hypothetical protein
MKGRPHCKMVSIGSSLRQIYRFSIFQNVDNSKEINYPTPQNSGVNGGLENQTLELCDEVKESHLPDGGNPSYAQTNSSGFPSTTFSNYVHPNPFYLVREIHGNLVYLQV